MAKVDYTPLPSYEDVEEMSHSNGNASIRTRLSPGAEGGSARKPSNENGRSLEVAEQREEEQLPRIKCPNPGTWMALLVWAICFAAFHTWMKQKEVNSVLLDLFVLAFVLSFFGLAYLFDPDFCKPIIKFIWDFYKKVRSAEATEV